MISFLLLLSLPFGLILLLLVLLARRRQAVDTIRLAEIGTILDRALRTFRSLLGPLLLLSLLVLPLGFGWGGTGLLLLRLNAGPSGAGAGGWLDGALQILGLVSVFGFGKTVLACGVGYAMQLRARGVEVTLGAIVRHGRWRQVLALAAVLAVPSAVATVLGLLGSLYMLNLAVAPFVLVDERCGPWAAMRRSTALVRPQFRALFNAVVTLWAVGWLVAAPPLLALGQLLTLLGASPTLGGQSLLTTIAPLGTVVVAPLMAVGSWHFRAYVLERSAAHEQPLDQMVERWLELPAAARAANVAGTDLAQAAPTAERA